MPTAESEQSARAGRRLGTLLRGKYRLDAVLGAGGMAVVYKATHRNQAEFAVKMLHSELSEREDVRVRFLREGYAANSVKHPGAVMVVDDDVAEDGAAFLVMELLHGAAIESLWEQGGGQLPVRVVLSIGDQLLDVLAAAHEKGIVHRDIKPANLFATKDGTLKVLDFGIARVKDATSATGSGQQTGTGLLLGTPAFMAPEQAYAKASEIDGQTDIWSVGATLFTLLSGKSVHLGDNSAQLMIHAATAHARPLASVLPDVPPEIAAVVDRALAFEKRDRWRTATEMRGAISQASRDLFGERPSKHPVAALCMTPVRAPWDPTMDPRPASSPAPSAPLPAAVTPPMRTSGVGPTGTRITPEPALQMAPPAAEAPVAAPAELTAERAAEPRDEILEPAPPPRSPIVGTTTASPIESDPIPGLPRPGGGSVAIVAAVVLVVGGGLWLARAAAGTHGEVIAATMSPPVPSSVEPSPSASGPPAPATTLSPAAPSATSLPAHPARTAGKAPAAPKPPATATPVPSAASAPTCTLVSEYGPDGQPLFKKVCK